jgi:hypothetical protein
MAMRTAVLASPLSPSLSRASSLLLRALSRTAFLSLSLSLSRVSFLSLSPLESPWRGTCR